MRCQYIKGRLTLGWKTQINQINKPLGVTKSTVWVIFKKKTWTGTSVREGLKDHRGQKKFMMAELLPRLRKTSLHHLTKSRTPEVSQGSTQSPDLNIIYYAFQYPKTKLNAERPTNTQQLQVAAIKGYTEHLKGGNIAFSDVPDF